MNNAGYSLAAIAECCTPGQVRQLFETLYFGAHCMCRAVLPQMRKQRTGLLVHISSFISRLPTPNSAHYAAAKAALEDAVAELAEMPFGKRPLRTLVARTHSSSHRSMTPPPSSHGGCSRYSDSRPGDRYDPERLEGRLLDGAVVRATLDHLHPPYKPLSIDMGAAVPKDARRTLRLCP